MLGLLHGGTAMGCLIAALYFYRFWRETRDRLFVLFAVAFAMLGVNRVALGLAHPTVESTPYLYVVRLVAFVLIAYAIVDKNRQR